MPGTGTSLTSHHVWEQCLLLGEEDDPLRGSGGKATDAMPHPHPQQAPWIPGCVKVGVLGRDLVPSLGNWGEFPEPEERVFFQR